LCLAACILIPEISGFEEKKVMKRRKVLPAASEAAEDSVEAAVEARESEPHYRLKKMMRPPVIPDCKAQ
jgi:hypothetical protein